MVKCALCTRQHRDKLDLIRFSGHYLREDLHLRECARAGRTENRHAVVPEASGWILDSFPWHFPWVIYRLMREIFVPSMLMPAISPCWLKINA